MVTNKEDVIEEILNNFNFFKVKDVMRQLDWKYTGSNEIPTLVILKETALMLLEDLLNNSKCNTIATGGFEAYKHADGIGLRFIVEDYTIEQ